ncbi:sigma-70 family RNA polymerase sigma factor [Altericroceibacterium spongiae]|uniref:Sigma-70 family RNA polymerase sigma factor n=1 Tax=Altericroceibacterium spongiae TaxID=2320269 RepID=A0A420EQT7_9SPHN|nr:sigma-70 family RNA polymerase sigma factor [Altericroceibacterium spongiae]RKF23010.1 sigma-70 family RNA polymerase sigma factor [Altericroceibacterium spongiae]
MSSFLSQDIQSDLVALRRYARSLTRDDQVADDVVQEALVRAIEKQSSFRIGSSVRSWMFGIIHNVYISMQRTRKAEDRRDERFAQTLTEQAEPEQEQAAILGQIARSFAALPDRQREVLHLVAVEGLSYREASEALDIPIGTVMSRLNRARTALRLATEEPDNMHERLRIVGGKDEN